jgi:hypothetical protein
MTGAAAPDVAADLSAPAFRLMGCGPGATPSGDDLLVGFLASWLAFRPDEKARSLARLLAREAPARTTRLAAEFYHHLALERLTDRLAILLRAVAGGDGAQVHVAAAALAAFGATSGLDTIAGVVCFLAASRPARAG